MAQRLLGMCRWLYCTCLLSLKRFGPVPLAPEWYFSLGGCDGPERSIFPNKENISLPREYFTLGGCAGPERTELRERLTEGSTELATVYWEGVCYLKLTWEGLVCAWNWKLDKTLAPVLYWETFMLLRLIRSHRLDNTPAKSTVPANDKWQITS